MKQKNNGIKRLLEFTGNKRGVLNLSRILSGISAIFILGPFLCVYFAARDLVDVFTGSPLDTESLVRWGIIALALELIGLLLYFCALLCSHVAAFHTEKNLKMAALKHLAKMPMGYFDTNPSGKLRKIIDENSFQTETFIAHQLPDLVGAQVTMVISLILMLIFDWRVGVPLLLLFGIGFFLQSSLMGKEGMKLMQTYQDSLETMNHEAVEYIRGISVLLVGGYLVAAGSLTVPMFILYLIFAGRIYDPFTSCFMLMAEVFSSLVSVKRMKQIDATPEQTGTNICNNKGFDIEFKDVHFSYNEEPVLKGVSFTAKQGEVTALVGPSGSGKSTASKLAARFWDSDSGKVTLGGVNVKTVEPETLFKNFAIVFQDVLLFDETVMENIRLGRNGATDEEVMAAAKAAQCEEFIQRLPQGYQTNIGENGSALSGGERQRISIARALLKNAPVVLLDEATASMDAESETLVQEALSALLKDKTVMVIAHRMRTVANADKIVVLDDGKISEMGTPQELMKKNGLYAHLVNLQRGK